MTDVKSVDTTFFPINHPRSYQLGLCFSVPTFYDPEHIELIPFPEPDERFKATFGSGSGDGQFA